MSAFLDSIRKNKIICIILFLFFAAKFFTLPNYRIVWWDSAVYTGMGKYIYSFGNAGLWESTRPVAWPLMLGFLWKIGLNSVFAGRILEIIFGSLCILLTYLTGKKLFNEKTGLLASVFLALSPTFFFFNGIMLTETVSTFFSLAAVYFFIEKRYFASGTLLGMAFMTRFIQLLVFIAIALILALAKKSIKNYTNIFLGFIVTTIPYLILNKILYSNALYPFFLQIALSKNSGWLNYHPISYYFIELFKENFLYLIFIFGVFLLLKNKDINKKIITFIFILFFAFFNSIKQKEMRFLIILLPYMYLLMSFLIVYIFDNLKNKTARDTLILLVIFSFIFSFNPTYIYYKNESNKNSQYIDLQDNFNKIAQGNIWISSPLISAFSDKKIGKLMYYPIFDEKKKNELIENAESADFIFLDACDLACKLHDTGCLNSKNELLESLKQRFKTAYYSKTKDCEQMIFRK